MEKYNAKDVTFENSKTIPFQRWYPYIQGYSPEFVKEIIANSTRNKGLIYEPFAGTGTTLFASDEMGFDTIYSEVNPVLRFLIDAKMKVLTLTKSSRNELGNMLLIEASNIVSNSSKCHINKQLDKAYNIVFGKSVYFPSKTYTSILKLRTYLDNFEDDKHSELMTALLTVAVFSILLDVSYLKKQGDVRFKTEKERETDMKSISDVLPQKIRQIAEDVINTNTSITYSHQLITENAKEISRVRLDNKISMVITSPPYLNGTNYFRNTKLELWFLRELHDKQDLRKFRNEALTSAICDVKRGDRNSEISFSSNTLVKVMKELKASAYDKRIPIMVKSYFEDMYTLFKGLSGHLDNGAELYIDLGDSIFNGTHVPTDGILSEIILSLGYILNERIILRQRRSRSQAFLSQVLLKYTYNHHV